MASKKAGECGCGCSCGGKVDRRDFLKIAGLGVMAILNLLVATPLVFIAIWPTDRSSRSLLGTLALLAFLLASVFTGPAFGFLGHGPVMRTASILLFFCAAAEFLAAVLVSTAAFLLGEPPAH